MGEELSRDRDATGRPRNARPRDGLGRPLPRDGSEPAPDPPALPPEQALAQAQALLDVGHAFTAHEVLEAVWKSTDGETRPLWRGLAQLAVGLTHLARGNAVGGRRLLERGAETLRPFAGASPYGVDVDGLLAWAADPDRSGRERPVLRRVGDAVEELPSSRADVVDGGGGAVEGER
jgi:hypothetical protein